MAYPLKKYTTAEYNALPTEVYEYVAYDQMYLMPEITDGNATWQISIHEPDETLITTLNTLTIQSGYRVLVISEFNSGAEQLYVVSSSGTDPITSKPWINASMVGNAADIEFKDLPKGTQIYWIIYTFFSITKKVALTDGEYLDPITNEYTGTYLDFMTFPVSLPVGNVRAEGIFVQNKKVKILVLDENSQTVFKQTYDPKTYGINSFIIKNNVTII